VNRHKILDKVLRERTLYARGFGEGRADVRLMFTLQNFTFGPFVLRVGRKRAVAFDLGPLTLLVRWNSAYYARYRGLR
jgi:hypothetical protein